MTSERQKVWAIGLVTMASLVAQGGCGNDQQTAGVQSGSSQFEETKTAYDDGFKEGKKAWMDVQPMWVWFKSEAYQSSFDRGWKDGRNLRKINEAE